MPVQAEMEARRGACPHYSTEAIQTAGGAVCGKRCQNCGLLWYARACKGCRAVMMQLENQKRRAYCGTACRSKAARQRAKEKQRQNPLTSNAR